MITCLTCEMWLFVLIFRNHLSDSTSKPSGHYTYRTVATIGTAQWSLYEPHSGHYMSRTVVTICTAKWSLYMPHCGHYMYRTLVTICAEEWSLYVPQSGHYMYHQFTYLLTHSLHGAESFLRSYLVLQLVKKFPAFYGTRNFITVFTSARHLSLS